jgi:predicted nucleotidyltransferase
VICDRSEPHRQVRRRIGEESGAERVILFGSDVPGSVRADSEVDILVVLRFEGRSVDKFAEIQMKLRPGFPVDRLVRAPEKIDEHLATGDSFIQEILSEGRVRYEADDG